MLYPYNWWPKTSIVALTFQFGGIIMFAVISHDFKSEQPKKKERKKIIGLPQTVLMAFVFFSCLCFCGLNFDLKNIPNMEALMPRKKSIRPKKNF